MKVAVTGAHGFIGKALCRALPAECVVRLTRSDCSNQPGEFRKFDLSKNCPRDLLEGIDVLIHAAHDFSDQSTDLPSNLNIRGTESLYESAENCGVGSTIFISSMAAFEGCRSLYGKTKIALEQSTLTNGGIVIRPGTVWSSSNGGFLGVLEKLVVALPVVPVFGGAHNRLFLVSLDDLIMVLLRAIEGRYAGCISVAHPQALTLQEILQRLADSRHITRYFFPVPSSLVYLPLKLAEMSGIKGLPRSDSVVSFLNTNPNPILMSSENLGVPLQHFH